MSPISLIIIGFFLVVYGMVMPFLMVLQMVEPTFFLAFTSYAATFSGLLLGVIGIATYTREHRSRKRNRDR